VQCTLSVDVRLDCFARASPPGLNDSRAFREDSGASYHAQSRARSFYPEKIASYANGFALFLAAKFR